MTVFHKFSCYERNDQEVTFSDKRFQNILRPFYVLPNLSFDRSETMHNYSLKT